MDVNDRISILIDELGIKQKDFSSRINIKPNTLSMIKSKKRAVTDRVVNDIVREFNVNKTWLVDGEGDIFLSNQTDYIDQLIKHYGLSDKDREIMLSYINMPEESKNLFFNFIQAVSGAKESE